MKPIIESRRSFFVRAFAALLALPAAVGLTKAKVKELAKEWTPADLFEGGKIDGIWGRAEGGKWVQSCYKNGVEVKRDTLVCSGMKLLNNRPQKPNEE